MYIDFSKCFKKLSSLKLSGISKYYFFKFTDVPILITTIRTLTIIVVVVVVLLIVLLEGRYDGSDLKEFQPLIC